MRRLATACVLLLAALPTGAHAASPAPDPFALVDPLVGTSGNGHTFPGADVPFGMVQFSPVTPHGGPGGYRYGDTRLRGFALTRLSGAGCTNYGDVPLMPLPSPAGARDAGFSHASESAHPGSYRVRLDSGISVALTATTRTGVAAFAYPASDPGGTVLVDPSAAANERRAAIRVVGRDELDGSATSAAFAGACGHPPGTYTVYFALRFRRPFRNVHVHAGRRAWVEFATSREPIVEAQVGLSFVSVAGARRNLAAETTTFARAEAQAAQRWRDLLDRVRVRGGSVTQQRIFYTALYHSLLQPSVFSDVDGRYPGQHGGVELARGYTQLTNVSGWDLYRTEMPLLALLAPRTASDLARSLVADAAETGRLPRWLLANAETRLMVGDPSDAILADAYAFGARDFDAQAALRAMIAGASLPDERPAVAQYLSLGYVAGAPATTLEYAVADFAVSQLAAALGDASDAATFLARSGSWRQTFDAQAGFVAPRLGGGGFPARFDPTAATGFVEGDAWQYTLMVPHDLGDLLAALGPPAQATRRLDRFFARLNAGPDAPHAWLGNEPSFGAPYAYLWLGEPWRSEAVVRRALANLFSDTPGGLPGNDDLGALSAWYVWSALGLYPAIPGVGGFAVVAPSFPRATVALPHGGTLRLVTAGSGPDIRSAALDGRPDDASWLPLAEVAKGGTLRFALGAAPTRWATAAASRPPSFAAPAGP